MFIYPFREQSHEDRLSRLNTMAKEAAAAVNEAGARPVRLSNHNNPYWLVNLIPLKLS